MNLLQEVQYDCVFGFRKAAKEGAGRVVPVIKCVGKRDGSKKHSNYAQYLLEGGALVFVNLDNMALAKYRGPETKTAKGTPRQEGRCA